MAWDDDLSDDVRGYFDGLDPTSPRPGMNRSFIYRHCWQVGRREFTGRHWTADKARRLADIAKDRDSRQMTGY